MKKVLSLILMVFLTMGILLTGCKQINEPSDRQLITEEPSPRESSTQEPIEQNAKLGDFFPLTMGSTWDYEGEGNEYASFTRKVLFARGDRAQIMEDNGGTISASVFETSQDSVTRIFFKGEEYGQENYINTEPEENLIILKAPLEVGTKWEEPNGIREIVDINATVDTPAGRYEECIKVKISSEDSTLYEFFKKDIGMVKREFIFGDNVVTSSIKEYIIK